MRRFAGLCVRWDKKQNDWLVSWDKRKPDGGMILRALDAVRCSIAELHPDAQQTVHPLDKDMDKLFREELIRRGFDPESLRITIRRMKE